MVILRDCSIEHWYYQLLSFVQSIVRGWRVGRWGDGEMGRWGDREMGRWGDGESVGSVGSNGCVPPLLSPPLIKGG